MKTKDLMVLLVVAGAGVALYFFTKKKPAPATPVKTSTGTATAPPDIYSGFKGYVQKVTTAADQTGSIITASSGALKSVTGAVKDFGSLFKSSPPSVTDNGASAGFYSIDPRGDAGGYVDSGSDYTD